MAQVIELARNDSWRWDAGCRTGKRSDTRTTYVSRRLQKCDARPPGPSRPQALPSRRRRRWSRSDDRRADPAPRSDHSSARPWIDVGRRSPAAGSGSNIPGQKARGADSAPPLPLDVRRTVRRQRNPSRCPLMSSGGRAHAWASAGRRAAPVRSVKESDTDPRPPGPAARYAAPTPGLLPYAPLKQGRSA